MPGTKPDGPITKNVPKVIVLGSIFSENVPVRGIPTGVPVALVLGLMDVTVGILACKRVRNVQDTGVNEFPLASERPAIVVVHIAPWGSEASGIRVVFFVWVL